MGRRHLTAVLAAVAFLWSLGIAPARAATPNGAAAVAACNALLATGPTAALGTKVCRTAEQFVWGAAATCRRLLALAPNPAATERCTPVDGRRISAAQVSAYQGSWVHRALQLQAQLDDAAPLAEEQMPHTHNSFNSSVYFPTLTNSDPNQVLSLPDQLSLDIRFLELDLHWVPSPFGSAATGGKWVTLCHGDSSIAPPVHIGCTWDRPLQDGLAEIRAWMISHPTEFVSLYLENQMVGDPTAHQIAAQLLTDAFGSWIAPTAPDGGACAPMPLTKSRADLRAAGSRMLIVGNCGPGNGLGTGWGSVVHERGPQWDESGNPNTYVSNHECDHDRAARLHDSTFRRWYGDSTWLTGVTSQNTDIPASTVALMVQCGANIVGFDQLLPGDARLAAFVWSWAPDQALNASGDCAAHEGTSGHDPGRITGADCGATAAFACTTADTVVWHVTTATGPWANGFAACPAEFPGMHFAAPVNGFRNQLLRESRSDAAPPVWLNYRNVGGSWTANVTSP
jgi:hypothetical protein